MVCPSIPRAYGTRTTAIEFVRNLYAIYCDPYEFVAAKIPEGQLDLKVPYVPRQSRRVRAFLRKDLV